MNNCHFGVSPVIYPDPDLILVRNRPVVYSRCEVGASVYFEHISSLLDLGKLDDN